jgi:hypothetical protein
MCTASSVTLDRHFAATGDRCHAARRLPNRRRCCCAACAEAFGRPLVTVDAALYRACADAEIYAVMLDDIAAVFG